jgi:hypothetical protein
MNAEKPSVTDPTERPENRSNCPVCGARVHSEAYCCSKCRNYFCYLCRIRLAPPETVLQCSHRPCKLFGKFVCSACSDSHEEADPPMIYLEPVDGFWPLWLLLSVIASAVVWYNTTAIAAIITAIGLYAGAGYLMQAAGINIFGKSKRVELLQRKKVYSCRQCSQRSKQVELPPSH